MTSVSKCQQNGTYYCNCSVTNDFVNSIRKKLQVKEKTVPWRWTLPLLHRACWEYAAFDVKCFLTPNAHSDINWDIVNLCMLMHYYSVLNWIGIWYIMIQEWILNLLLQRILNSSQTKTQIFLKHEQRVLAASIVLLDTLDRFFWLSSGWAVPIVHYIVILTSFRQQQVSGSDSVCCIPSFISSIFFIYLCVAKITPWVNVQL